MPKEVPKFNKNGVLDGAIFESIGWGFMSNTVD